MYLISFSQWINNLNYIIISFSKLDDINSPTEQSPNFLLLFGVSSCHYFACCLLRQQPSSTHTPSPFLQESKTIGRKETNQIPQKVHHCQLCYLKLLLLKIKSDLDDLLSLFIITTLLSFLWKSLLTQSFIGI